MLLKGFNDKIQQNALLNCLAWLDPIFTFAAYFKKNILHKSLCNFYFTERSYFWTQKYNLVEDYFFWGGGVGFNVPCAIEWPERKI